MDEINMTFIHTIDLTAAVNISIYLKTDDEYLLRQTLLCTDPHCIINNDYSLTIKLLDNTFNTPNANYSIEIDDNFLRYRNESETIPGIKRGSWMIKTGIFKLFKLLTVNIDYDFSLVINIMIFFRFKYLRF